MQLYFHFPHTLMGLCSLSTEYIFMAWYLVKHSDNFTLPLHMGTYHAIFFFYLEVYMLYENLSETNVHVL